MGTALGRTDRAEELAAEVEQDFADAAAAHPEFEGAEVAVAAFTSDGYGAYVRGDSRVDFMEQLGFELDPGIQELATEIFYVPISEEQVPLLDAELTVAFPIYVEAAESAAGPLWQTLDSVQAGRAVVLEDDTLVNAFSSGSPLGIRYAIENAVPEFAEALGRARARRALTPGAARRGPPATAAPQRPAGRPDRPPAPPPRRPTRPPGRRAPRSG